MDTIAEGDRYHVSKNRLETLVDGIFAIAMTLLVLTVNVKKPAPDEAQALLPGILENLLPQIFTLVVAFIVLAVFWQAHNRQFRLVRAVDTGHLWLTILMLIAIVLIPFSTDVSGDFPNVGAAAFLFNLNIFMVGIVIALHWRYICRHPHLCDPLLDQEAGKLWSSEVVLIPTVAFAGMILSFVSPAASLLIYLVVPIVWYFLNRHLSVAQPVQNCPGLHDPGAGRCRRFF